MKHQVYCQNIVLCTSTSTNNLTNSTSSPLHQLSPKIQANFDSYEDCDKTTCPDFHFPDKYRGSLLLEPGDFQFVSPDREPVTITSIDQCIDIANTIRQMGKPKYQQGRYTLNLCLILDKCEDYVRDYPLQKLTLYLKFGSPPSVKDSDTLKNNKQSYT